MPFTYSSRTSSWSRFWLCPNRERNKGGECEESLQGIRCTPTLEELVEAETFWTFRTLRN